MEASPRDQNHIPALILESSSSPGVVISAKGDELTGRLLVDLTGGGTGSVIFYTPTGNVDGINAVFTVLGEPSSVVSDGATYFDGAGYTYAALSITMQIPPSGFIRYTL